MNSEFSAFWKYIPIVPLWIDFPESKNTNDLPGGIAGAERFQTPASGKYV